jgi:hypothetical protein
MRASLLPAVIFAQAGAMNSRGPYRVAQNPWHTALHRQMRLPSQSRLFAHRQLQGTSDQTLASNCSFSDAGDDAVTDAGWAYNVTSCADVVPGSQFCGKDTIGLCPISCGVCSAGGADLSELCDCFVSGWESWEETAGPHAHCIALAETLLPIAKAQCGATWYNTAWQEKSMTHMTPDDMLSFGLMMGAHLFELRTDDTVFRNLWNNYPLDSPTFSSLDTTQLQQMGFTVGEALRVQKAWEDYNFGWYHTPPYEDYKVWDPPGPNWEWEEMNPSIDVWDAGLGLYQWERVRTLIQEGPIEVATTVVLESLIGIDEVNFCFEAQFLLVMAWKDYRINTQCHGADANARGKDQCGHYWTPTMPPVFANQVSIDGNPAIEVIEDLGLFTIPGRLRYDCDFGAGSSDREKSSCEDTGQTGTNGGKFMWCKGCEGPLVDVSTAYRMMRIKGSFGASMEFRRFPYDRQALEIVIRPPPQIPGSADPAAMNYIFAPKAVVDPAIMEQQAKSAANNPDDPGKDVIAGWRVTRMSASERSLIANTTFWDANNFVDGAPASADPLFALMESVTEQGPQSVADANIPYFSAPLSEAVIVVHVCRIPSSYVINFVILISCLEFIAFVSYLLLPGEFDPRVNLTLTVFLGVIFFQIMLSEMLPTTGYLTDMHYFTFFSTVLPVLIAISHVFIFGASALGARKEELLNRTKALRKSRSAMRKTIMIQRLVRRHLARKRLQESRRLHATEVHPAGSEGNGELKGSEVRALADLGSSLFRLQSVRDSSFQAKVLRLFIRVRQAIELICVYSLSWMNWGMALAFALAYIVVVMVVFKGQGGEVCS